MLAVLALLPLLPLLPLLTLLALLLLFALLALRPLLSDDGEADRTEAGFSRNIDARLARGWIFGAPSAAISLRGDLCGDFFVLSCWSTS